MKVETVWPGGLVEMPEFETPAEPAFRATIREPERYRGKWREPGEWSVERWWREYQKREH